MNEQVFKKRGRRYVPIGYSDGFTGFPADGIWLVIQEDGKKSSECIMRIGEMQDLRPTVDLIANHRDDILEYMMSSPNIHIHGSSYLDVVNNLLKHISKKFKNNV